VVLCLGLNYVLAWMVIRQRSIVAAIVTHALWNFLVFHLNRQQLPLVEGRLYLGLWAIAAIVLYRWWPLESEPIEERVSAEPAAEAAV
jgi:hypothetical protein